MIYFLMHRIQVDNAPMLGYGKYMLAEYNQSVGRKMVSWYIYEVTDEVADEMIAKGAKEESRSDTLPSL